MGFEMIKETCYESSKIGTLISVFEPNFKNDGKPWGYGYSTRTYHTKNGCKYQNHNLFSRGRKVLKGTSSGLQNISFPQKTYFHDFQLETSINYYIK